MSRLSKGGPLPFNYFNRQLGNRCLKPYSINVTLICCLRLPDYFIELIHSEQVSTLLSTSENSNICMLDFEMSLRTPKNHIIESRVKLLHASQSLFV